MTLTDPARHDILRAMAAHVLTHGVQTASLRPLAKAAGTSDRMLIYHFGSKDALIAAILHTIAADLAGHLSDIGGPADAVTILRRVWALCRTDEIRPYMRVWLELTSIASRDGGAMAQLGHAIAQGFLDWIAANLTHPPDAPLVLTLLEGALVLTEVGKSDCIEQALATLESLIALRRT